MLCGSFGFAAVSSMALVVALLFFLVLTVTSSQELGWIVAGPNRTADGVPSCSYCLNVLNATEVDYTGYSVAIYRCLKFDRNEQWAIDTSTHAIFLRDPGNRTLCLDAGNQSDYSGATFVFVPMVMSRCDGSLRQQWFFDSTTGLVRSGLRSSNGSALYMVQGTLPDSGVPYTIPYYNLYLATSVTGSSAVNAQFTFQAASNYQPLLLRSCAGCVDVSGSGNLVGNGGFERSTILPRATPGQMCWLSTPGTSCSKSKLFASELFALCSWAVVRAPEWISNRRPDWTAAEGNSSLLLSNGGAVSQTIAVQGNAAYVLSFAMAGYLTHSSAADSYQLCMPSSGYVLVQVGVVEAPVSFTLDQSQVSRDGQHPEWVTQSMRFTASGTDTVISFASGGGGPCSVVIDDVRVSLDTTRHSVPSSSSSGSNRTAAVAASVAVAFAVLVWVSAWLGVRAWRRRTRRDFPLLVSPEAQKVKILSYNEIRRATGNWNTVVGTGAFSTVYRADFPDGTVGAVKVENKRGALTIEPSVFREELALLQRLNHRAIVNLVGYCDDTAHPILVFEFLPNGTLYQRLHEAPDELVLPWRARMKIVYQVACALEYLHHGSSPPVVHRDIKSANVLLTATDSAKLADLGLSRSGVPGATSFPSVQSDAKVKGSLGYLDPRYLRSGIYSPRSDVYSFGVLVLETVSGHKAIKDGDLLAYWAAEYIQNPLTAHQLVDVRLMGDYAHLELQILVHLVRNCLQNDPHERPSMQQVVQSLTDADFGGQPPSTPVAVPHSIPSGFATPAGHSFEAADSSAASSSSQALY